MINPSTRLDSKIILEPTFLLSILAKYNSEIMLLSATDKTIE